MRMSHETWRSLVSAVLQYLVRRHRSGARSVYEATPAPSYVTGITAGAANSVPHPHRSPDLAWAESERQVSRAGPKGLAELLGAVDSVDWIELDVPPVDVDQLRVLWITSPRRALNRGTGELNVRPSYPCPRAGIGA